MNDQKMKCKDCNFWKPTYQGVGHCTAEGMPNAKHWIEGPQGTRLLTLSTFGCEAGQAKTAIEKEII